MKKGNKLYSIIKMKCPRCHEGDMFINKSAYQFKGFFDMHDRCEVCNQKFELETGFFYGAMYVNYALTIALSIALYVAFSVLYPIHWVNFLIIDLIFLILIAPYMFKMGRVLWANMFIHYKGKDDTKKS